MTIVVTDNCRNCRFTECVSVCPVRCFHLGEDMLFINPATCIECRACIPLCPVEAIYDTDDLPPEKEEWIGINATRSQVLPIVAGKLVPLPSAESKRASLGL